MPIKNKLYKVARSEQQYCFRPNLLMWPDKTLLFGPLRELTLHSMGSITINVGLYQPFSMNNSNGPPISYSCAIIPAGFKHELNGNGNIVASLIIEKNSVLFESLKKQFSFHSSSITNINDDMWISIFRMIYEEKPTKSEIDRLLNELLLVDYEPKINLDSRVEQAMTIIQLSPNSILTQEDLASSVSLSSSRFRHLFREQTNIPFRSYRIWQRVLSAIKTLHQVDNLTHAAMEAGFTDSAHFHHCFKNSLGVNPSLVFKNIDRFEI